MTTKLSFSRALLFLAAFLLVGVVSPIEADSIPGSQGTLGGFGFSFDENGNGVFTINGGPNTALQGVLSPDPSGSGIPMALTYFLPGGTVANGDVLVSSATESLSDVIRFTDAAGNLTGTTADRMIYYSDVTPGDVETALADTPAPPINLGSGASATATETGPEGGSTLQGFLYNPDSSNAYFGVSDSPTVTPEPSSLILLGSSLLVLWRFRHGRAT